MQKPKKKYTKKDPRQCLIKCCWQQCQYEVIVLQTQYHVFSKHLTSHINDYMCELQQEEEKHGREAVIYCCMWQNCSWEGCENFHELRRHVMFHGYHSFLKSIGLIDQNRLKLNVCSIEGNDHYPMLLLMSGPQNCAWKNCNISFACPNELYRHVENHVAEEALANFGLNSDVKSPCSWGACKNEFRDKHKLKEHIRTHTQEKLFACPTCGGLFSNRTKFIDHLSRQNVDAYDEFQCSHCLKRCASERLLRDHMRHHVNYLKCPQCDMTCPNPASLKSHVKYRHKDQRSYHCSMCDQKFKSNTDLMRHEESHLPKRYICQFKDCDFSTKTSHGLNRHHRVSHGSGVGKKFVCHICEQTYSRGFGLTKHLKKKHNFSWPSGHSRFRYVEYDDGLLRLQMVRFESAELTKRLRGNTEYFEDTLETRPSQFEIAADQYDSLYENSNENQINLQVSYTSKDAQNNSSNIDIKNSQVQGNQYMKLEPNISPSGELFTESVLTEIPSAIISNVNPAHCSSDLTESSNSHELPPSFFPEESKNQKRDSNSIAVNTIVMDDSALLTSLTNSKGYILSHGKDQNDRLQISKNQNILSVSKSTESDQLLGLAGDQFPVYVSHTGNIHIKPKPKDYKDDILTQLIAISSKQSDSTNITPKTAALASSLYNRLLETASGPNRKSQLIAIENDNLNENDYWESIDSLINDIDKENFDYEIKPLVSDQSTENEKKRSARTDSKKGSGKLKHSEDNISTKNNEKEIEEKLDVTEALLSLKRSR